MKKKTLYDKKTQYKSKEIVYCNAVNGTLTLNFLNGIIHLTFIEQSIIIFRDIKVITWSWSANSIEPSQTALYWWQRLITFGFGRIRVKKKNKIIQKFFVKIFFFKNFAWLVCMKMTIVLNELFMNKAVRHYHTFTTWQVIHEPTFYVCVWFAQHVYMKYNTFFTGVNT